MSIPTTVCDNCGNKLSVFRKKKPCVECRKQLCSQCLQRCPDRLLRCKSCLVLTKRPPFRPALLALQVKELQNYLNRHNISTRGCLEKEDLVNVLIRHANNPGGNSRGFSQHGNSENPLPEASLNTPVGNVHVRAADHPSSQGTSGSSSASNLPRRAPDQSHPEVGLSSHSRPPPPSNPLSTGSANQGFHNRAAAGQTDQVAGDSDSSSNTSFEIVHMESATSVHSSSSSSSISKISSQSTSTTPASSGLAGQPGVSVTLTKEAAAISRQTSLEESISSPGSSSAPPQADNVSSDIPEVSVSPDTPSSESSTQSSTVQTSFSNNSPNFLRGTMASISSESDFEGFSVKQLKDILHRHRVNYHGCCEKAELVERAKRLYRDYQSTRAELEKLDLDALCKICMDAPVECVMLECGHMATCTDCGRQLSECPICRQFVVRIVRTFKA